MNKDKLEAAILLILDQNSGGLKGTQLFTYLVGEFYDDGFLVGEDVDALKTTEFIDEVYDLIKQSQYIDSVDYAWRDKEKTFIFIKKDITDQQIVKIISKVKNG